MLKPELQAKFLQHISSRKNRKEEGFTLIELLVVIIIIGVLAAIALPSLLNQVSKGRQAEAQQNVGALDRAQQAYYLENANSFTTNLGDLALGIKSQTTNYQYSILTNAGVTSDATNFGSAIVNQLKSYAGITYVTTQSAPTTEGGASSVQSLTETALCQGTTPVTSAPDNPTKGGTNAGDCTAITSSGSTYKVLD
jgi:type IV pilus assembly protein PilA